MPRNVTVKVSLGDVKRRFTTDCYSSFQEKANELFGGVCRLTLKADGTAIDSEQAFARLPKQQTVEVVATREEPLLGPLNTMPAARSLTPQEQQAERLRYMTARVEMENLHLHEERSTASTAATPSRPAPLRPCTEQWDSSCSDSSDDDEPDQTHNIYSCGRPASASCVRSVPSVPRTVTQKKLARDMRARASNARGTAVKASSATGRAPKNDMISSLASSDPPRHDSMSATRRSGPGAAVAASSLAVVAVSAGCTSQIQDLRHAGQQQHDAHSTSSSSGCEDEEAVSFVDAASAHMSCRSLTHMSPESETVCIRIPASSTASVNHEACLTAKAVQLEFERSNYPCCMSGACACCDSFHHELCEDHTDCRDYIQWLVLQNQILTKQLDDLTGRRHSCSSLPARPKPRSVSSSMSDDAPQPYRFSYEINPDLYA